MKTKLLTLNTIIISIFIIMGCTGNTKKENTCGCSTVKAENFDKQVNGKQVKLYELNNPDGIKVLITNYGGIIVSICAPDTAGNYEDIVLGYDSIDSYVKHISDNYFGALIGRYGNRIGKGRFSIDGQVYQLTTNNGENHLHGGPGGYHQVVWEVTKFENNVLALHYGSPDMEEGYPGKLSVDVTYTLTPDNGLKIDYKATTDKKTIVNLTSHPYFNLTGQTNETINGHLLQIMADYYTPVDSGLIPTGEIAEVKGTPFDFRELKAIGQNLEVQDEQINYGGGYDHNFVLRESNSLRLVAKVVEEKSGRIMEVYSIEPGLQFYGGNFLDGSLKGHCSVPYGHRTGFCLETQHYPDSPNKPDWPSTILEPGQEYATTTIYKFLVKN